MTKKPKEQVEASVGQVNPIPVGDADPNIAVGSATGGVPIAGGHVAKTANKDWEPLKVTVEKAKDPINAHKFNPETKDK